MICSCVLPSLGCLSSCSQFLCCRSFEVAGASRVYFASVAFALGVEAKTSRPALMPLESGSARCQTGAQSRPSRVAVRLSRHRSPTGVSSPLSLLGCLSQRARPGGLGCPVPETWAVLCQCHAVLITRLCRVVVRNQPGVSGFAVLSRDCLRLSGVFRGLAHILGLFGFCEQRRCVFLFL